MLETCRRCRDCSVARRLHGDTAREAAKVERHADGILQSAHGEPAAAALRTGVAQYREPIVTRHSSGAQRFCVVTAVPLLDDDGEPASVLSTFYRRILLRGLGTF